jgi:hypothetical protein
MAKPLLTLNKIKEADPCKSSWRKLLSFLGKTNADNEPLTFKQVIDACGVTDAIWCFQVIDEPQLIGEFTLKLATRAAKHCDTPEAEQCRKVHKAFLKGKATREELKAAAFRAVFTPDSVAYSTARAAAAAAAAAACTTDAAAAAAYAIVAAAVAAAYNTERKWQAKLIIKMFDGVKTNDTRCQNSAILA